ncbi:NADH dehydrogenase [ubiquinone] 1 beta subcomplex subunit 3-A [Morella rubra]|uniref:NADH dehydrogenase [ubiquinone] 1 beta subcomplex subunit 3-A n=1 Tax=Morella rubra TaxID=262757 RepID=A0A6A1VCL2_9ROSI|nr:NADH dehydrogenase [ubiquinone] 1 beta subcomplex subunit 3-A [Morella rubra]
MSKLQSDTLREVISQVMANTALRPIGEFFRRRDEWRKHSMLTNQLHHATPDLGIALVAFGIYLIGEQVYNILHAPSSSHNHHSAPSTSSTSH